MNKKAIEIEKYRESKSDFIANLKRRNISSWDTLNVELSLYCACFGLPVIAATIFCLEDYPEYSSELNKKIKVLVEFYDYDLKEIESWTKDPC